MKRIDTTTLKPYYVEDNDAQIAKVGHVNYVISAVSSDNDVTAIDPQASGNGVPVATEFKKDEFVTYPSGLQGYKLSVEADLNDPASNVYDLFLGFFKVAPGTTLELKGFSGNTIAEGGFFGPITFTSLFSIGATVKDSAGPGLITLDNYADVYLIQNPFDLTEYYLAMYASASSDFQAKVKLEVSLAVTAGASFQYLRDL